MRLKAPSAALCRGTAEQLWVSVRGLIERDGASPLRSVHTEPEARRWWRAATRRANTGGSSQYLIQRDIFYEVRNWVDTFHSLSHRRPCPLVYWWNHCLNAGWPQPQWNWSYHEHTSLSLWRWGQIGGTDGVDCLITTVEYREHWGEKSENQVGWLVNCQRLKGCSETHLSKNSCSPFILWVTCSVFFRLKKGFQGGSLGISLDGG